MQAVAAVLRSAAAPMVLEPIDLPDPGAGEVLIRVIAAGLCHTDLLPRSGGPFGRPPVILGHEGAGVVEAVGSGVENLAVGDHVVVSFDACGACARCRAGRRAYCARFWELNFAGAPSGAALARDADGAPVGSRWFGQSTFATHAIVSAQSAIGVDPALPLERLAPLGCGVLTGAASILQALSVPEGGSVAVIGVGAVGLAAVMAARIAGAAEICAVDQNPERLALADRFGATSSFDVRNADLTVGLRAIVPEGFGHILDTTGVPAVIADAVEALDPVGTCGLVGSPRGDLVLGRSVLASGRTIRGILFGDADPQVMVPRLIELWTRGLLPFDELIQTWPLEEIDEAERAFRAGKVVKPVLLPKL